MLVAAIKETRAKCLHGRIAALRGFLATTNLKVKPPLKLRFRNLAVYHILSRLLRSMRPLASIRAALAAVLTDTPLAGVALMLPLQWLTAVVMPPAGALHPAQRVNSAF